MMMMRKKKMMKRRRLNKNPLWTLSKQELFNSHDSYCYLGLSTVVQEFKKKNVFMYTNKINLYLHPPFQVYIGI